MIYSVTGPVAFVRASGAAMGAEWREPKPEYRGFYRSTDRGMEVPRWR